jgi:outer membrane receptor protein involved in Fe transport
VLKGAQIEIEPVGISGVSSNQGNFTITNLAPGNYDVIVSYVGFAPFSTNIVVNAGAVTRVDALLKVASKNEEVVVYAERPHGEAEAINRTRSADNILQVLPSEVITSLPNANIADALGRLPSVTIERDEGEGKYVQIRGTEPRLSNLTIDGINIPSPESGVRQIKLDTLASDLVESVEINKTLQANQDGDGIGGSVNLKTKTAGDQPTVSLFGIGGYTPIIGGRGVDQFGATVGKRFGEQKKLGILFGGTYDWNGRGINDIEPSPTVGSIAPHYDSIDLRDYEYYRSRWGFSGSTDYKLSEGSTVYLRGLFSQFRNWGQKWVYSLNDGDVPKASIDWRRPDYAIASLVAGGHHVFTSSWMSWDLSVARSRMLASGGNGGASFGWNGDDTNCFDDPSATNDQFRPQFSASCYTPGTTDVLDIANYKLKKFNLPSTGLSAQLNLQGSASFAKSYHVGSHQSTFEFGAKVRNGHKFDDSYSGTYSVATGVPAIPIDQFAGGFSDSGYYDKSYKFALKNVDFNKVSAFVAANPGLFTFDGGPGVNEGNYDLIERVTAGYLMNTVDLTSRVRLITGIRFEATHLDTLSFDNNTGGLTYKAGGDYLDVLPSASVRFALTKESGLRLVYSRALARPNPQDIAQAVSPIDDTVNPHTVSLGNPNLKAEHANNYDILYEHYLTPLGLIQAGFFYKDLTDPITSTITKPTSGPYAGFLVSQPGNAGSASLKGFEIAYQQRLTFLPGVLRGAGISTNYSYTTSEAHNVYAGRSDSPALLRQAPNTWNISPTYDTKRYSVRVGMTFNDAMIYQYQWADGADPVAGIKGPAGDIYLYKHFQVDAQGTVQLGKGLSFVAYGLNLNNEVFGFFNGSPQYVLQREFYKPTYATGIRWTSGSEK